MADQLAVAVKQDKTKKHEMEARAKNISKGLSSLAGIAFAQGMQRQPMAEEMAIRILAKNPVADKKEKVISCDGDFWLMCTIHL